MREAGFNRTGAVFKTHLFSFIYSTFLGKVSV